MFGSSSGPTPRHLDHTQQRWQRRYEGLSAEKMDNQKCTWVIRNHLKNSSLHWLNMIWCDMSHLITPVTLQVGPESSCTTVKFEDFRDYSSSRFSVTISRAQHVALQHACAPVPLPSRQLDLASAKKVKKTRSYHGCFCGQFLSLPKNIDYIVTSELASIILSEIYLRQYVSVEKLVLQDGWTVDVRKRMKGKAQGGIYMVYITPQGRQRLTLTLGLGLVCTSLQYHVLVTAWYMGISCSPFFLHERKQ